MWSTRGLKSFNAWPVVYRLLWLIGPLASVGFRVHSAVFQQARARVVVVNEYGEVLLVRSALGSRCWTLPGGGVDKGESSARAAARELSEELQVTVSTEELRELTTIIRHQHATHHYDAPLFWTVLEKDAIDLTARNKLEIADVRWFSLGTLPHDMTYVTEAGLSCLQATVDVGKIKEMLSSEINR